MADWMGGFGKEYTMRNGSIPSRNEFFENFLGYGIERAFEVGCNWGANLVALETLGIRATGCDVNQYAIDRASEMGLDAYVGSGTCSGMNDDAYDFVYTVGVLIHQQTADLIKMMKEMVRISNRYVMFAEYNGKDEEIPYRGERSALFKREFGAIFEAIFPRARLVESGEAGRSLGFDDVTYWMYDISNCASPHGLDQTTWKSFAESEEREPIGSFVTTVGKVSTD